MPYVTNYAAPVAGVGQAAYQAGLGDYGFRREQFAEQQRQFNSGQQYRYDALAEQSRQYDTSLAEQQRQYDTTLGRQAEIFNAEYQQKNNLAQLQAQSSFFNQTLGEYGANQRQSAQIAANERMAMFEQQARMQSLQYQAEINSRQAYQDAQLRAGLLSFGASVEVDQFNQMANAQRAQELAKLQQQYQIVANSQDLSAADKAYAVAQIRQQAAGLQQADPLQFMDPTQRDIYLKSQSQVNAKRMGWDTLSNTGLTIDQLTDLGYVPFRDPSTGSLSLLKTDSPKISQIEAQSKLNLANAQNQREVDKARETSKQEFVKSLAGLIEKDPDTGKSSLNKDVLPMLKLAYPEFFPEDTPQPGQAEPTPAPSASIEQPGMENSPQAKQQAPALGISQASKDTQAAYDQNYRSNADRSALLGLGGGGGF